MMDGSNDFGGYEIFTAKRKELLALTHKAAEILHDLDIPSQSEIVPEIEERVERDTFKILVIGEFNSGKSTLINAMLGRSVLPTYAVETTAIINEIKWGEHPHAVVHEKGTGKAIKVSIDELEQFVVVNEIQRERPGTAMRESSYDKAEIFWPLQLCRNGVEIIDSPGLNAHELREKITVEYLAKVDAVVFVMTAHRLAAASELKVIDTIIRPAGHQDIFFVCNRFNELRTERDREMVRRAGLEKLAGRTKLGARRIFFMNALGALEGRESGDEARLQESGLPPLESDLQDFLVHDRGTIKLMRAVFDLKRAVRSARITVPQQEELLKGNLTTLEEKARNAHYALEDKERKRRELFNEATLRLKDDEVEIETLASAWIMEVAEKIPEFVANHDMQASVKFTLSKSKMEEYVQEIVKELAETVNSAVSESFIEWSLGTLKPFLEMHVKALVDDIGPRADVILSEIDQLRMETIKPGTEIHADSTSVSLKTPSVTERVIAGLGGLLFLDIGSGVLGGAFGYSGLLRSILPQLAIVIGGFALGLGPLVIVAMSLAGAGFSATRRLQEANEKIKEKFASQASEEMAKLRVDQAKAISASAFTQMTAVRDAIDRELAVQIASVKEQFDAARAEHQKGQRSVDAKLAVLAAQRRHLDEIDGSLDDILQKIASFDQQAIAAQ